MIRKLATKRSYSNTLRQNQSELTKKLILQALNEIVVANPMLSFTIEEVAERAGVSHRSVYRHFPTRKALFEALYETNKELLNPFRVEGLPTSADDIPLLPHKFFSLFNEHPSVTRALNVASMTLHIKPTTREENNKIMRQLLAGVTSNLPAVEASRALAVMRYLLSALAWQALQERFGLNSSEAAKAISWALDVLVRDLRQRNVQARNVSKSKEDEGNG